MLINDQMTSFLTLHIDKDSFLIMISITLLFFSIAPASDLWFLCHKGCSTSNNTENTFVRRLLDFNDEWQNLYLLQDDYWRRP